jgi:hypothetical protein
MPDYGRELEFGAFIPPVAEQADDVLELARLADVVGLDLGHLPGSPVPAELLDTWTLLAVVAAQATNVQVAPNVANLPLRPPVVLADRDDHRAVPGAAMERVDERDHLDRLRPGAENGSPAPLRGACVTRLRVAATRRVPGRHRRLIECHRRCSAGADRKWCSTMRRGGRRDARQQHKHRHQRKLDHRPLVSLLRRFGRRVTPHTPSSRVKDSCLCEPTFVGTSASLAADLQRGAALQKRLQAPPAICPENESLRFRRLSSSGGRI